MNAWKEVKDQSGFIENGLLPCVNFRRKAQHIIAFIKLSLKTEGIFSTDDF